MISGETVKEIQFFATYILFLPGISISSIESYALLSRCSHELKPNFLNYRVSMLKTRYAQRMAKKEVLTKHKMPCPSLLFSFS